MQVGHYQRPHHHNGAMQPPGSPLAPYQQAMLATMAASPGQRSAGPYTPQHGTNTMMTPVRTAPHHHHQQQYGHSMQRYDSMTPSRSMTHWASPKSEQQPQRAMSQPRAAKESAPIPHARCRLADDLRSASHDELVQLLVELSSYSTDAAGFIECKAQALRLQSIADSDRGAYGSVATHLAMDADATPEKMSGTAHATPTRAAPDAEPEAPATPFDKIERGQHQPPEHREFLEGRHPCLTAYGKCRNPQSCVFVRAPCNLCTAWIRGNCPDGARCTYVHRLPSDAAPALKHLYDVKMARAGHTVQTAAAAAAPSSVAATPTPQRSMRKAQPHH